MTNTDSITSTETLRRYRLLAQRRLELAGATRRPFDLPDADLDAWIRDVAVQHGLQEVPSRSPQWNRPRIRSDERTVLVGPLVDAGHGSEFTVVWGRGEGRMYRHVFRGLARVVMIIKLLAAAPILTVRVHADEKAFARAVLQRWPGPESEAMFFLAELRAKGL